jgi:predicted proteasome-type protease
MAEKHVVVICVTVGALALAAAVLGIIGEATKSRASRRLSDSCIFFEM